MKLLWFTWLAVAHAACSEKRPDAGASDAAAQALIGHQLRQLAGPGVAYAPLAWRTPEPLYPRDAGEALMQQQVGLWVSDHGHSQSFLDSLPLLQGPEAQARSAAWQRALASASAAGARARRRAARLSRLADSLHRTPRPPAGGPSTRVIGYRGWHTYRLTDASGRTHRDSVQYIRLASGTAFICFPPTEFPLASRFWEPPTHDPF